MQNPLPEIPLINGVMHSWASIRIPILGVAVTGITGINYGEQDGKENQFGIGRFTIGRGYGNVTTNCDISLYRDVIDALERIAPNGRIQDIPPFDIPVSFITAGGKYKKHVLKNFEFTENKVEGQQGATGLISTIACIISHVDWNPR
ncbi:hypothetical protein LJC16_02120 [Bacteroidales bacterium OttesenSCG-928-C19]|nr:hypothetical protein [Bacteroidales bacterium OttesenSCG-928-C19]